MKKALVGSKRLIQERQGKNQSFNSRETGNTLSQPNPISGANNGVMPVSISHALSTPELPAIRATGYDPAALLTTSEVAKLLRQTEVEHKKKTKDQLIKELRDAEEAGDDEVAAKLRTQLLTLIKETA